jgi:hypothetical protein
MLQGVQDVLGVEGQSTLDHEQAVAAALVRKAAPALLAACEAAEECLAGFGPEGDRGEALRMLRAAIAQAEPPNETDNAREGGRR